MEERKLPFEGIRVCDFSWYAAAPVATKCLADFGAEVIKMEYSAHPDLIRIAMPQAPGKVGDLGAGGWFNNENSSKLCLGLNLAHPRAKEIYDKLILASDIVVENFSPAVKERMGLNYEDYAKLKPDIIWVDQPMQGLVGPHKYTPGFGSIIAPLGGLSYLSGFPHRPPVGTGTNYPDYVINPGHLAIAIVAALRYRKRTGRGQQIVMAQLASTVSVLETAILDYAVNNRIPPRLGNRIPYAAPHGCYRCRGEDRDCLYYSMYSVPHEIPGRKDDRWCVIAVFTDEEWEAFCDAIGNPPWTLDPKFSTLLGRKENEDELDRLLGEWTINFTAEEVMSLLQAKGVAAGVVEDLKDMFEDPQMKHYGFLRYIEHPVMGEISYQGPPFRLSKTPDGQFSAPCLGQHNEYVYKKLLGLSDEEIAELLIEKVITTEADLPEFRPST